MTGDRVVQPADRVGFLPTRLTGCRIIACRLSTPAGYNRPRQQTRGIHPMLFQCWASVEDAGPTLKQHWVDAPACWAKYPVIAKLWLNAGPTSATLSRHWTSFLWKLSQQTRLLLLLLPDGSSWLAGWTCTPAASDNSSVCKWFVYMFYLPASQPCSQLASQPASLIIM